MAGVLDTITDRSQVTVIRLRSLGDCVLTTPALHLLKRTRPDLEINLVVEPRFSAVFENNPDVCHILPPEMTTVMRHRPALCVNLHGGTRSHLLTLSTGARHRAAFAHVRHAWLYNVRIPTAQQILGVGRKVHTAEHLACAMFHLGVPQQPVPRARLFPHTQPPYSHSYSVVHPFAALPSKTWQPEKFVELGRQLEREHALEPVFLAGPDDDASPFSQFRVVRPALRESIALISGARLFVGNDSGPAHIAAAADIPLVVLFGPSDPVIWAPWRASSAQIVVAEDRDVRSITAEAVFASIPLPKVARQ